MPKDAGSNLDAYNGRIVTVKLNGNRRVEGTLRGYDKLMNIVLENAFEVISDTDKHEMGAIVIRGNSIIQMECEDV